MTIDTMLDGLDSYLDQAKKSVVDLRTAGETSRELSLVTTKIEEAEHWLAAHRTKREAGSHEAAQA